MATETTWFDESSELCRELAAMTGPYRIVLLGSSPANGHLTVLYDDRGDPARIAARPIHYPGKQLPSGKIVYQIANVPLDVPVAEVARRANATTLVPHPESPHAWPFEAQYSQLGLAGQGKIVPVYISA